MTQTSIDLLLMLTNCNTRIAKKLDHSLGSVHGLGLNEFLVLHHLTVEHSPVSRIHLADLLGLTASGVTRLLQPMEKLGLVERQVNKRDARHSLVKISNSGASKFSDALVGFDDSMRQLMEPLSVDDKATLLAILSKIR